MAKDSRVVLQNTNKDLPREVFAADGESVHIMPGAKQPVDKKFLWNLPADVREFTDHQVVFGKKTRTVNVTKKSGNTVSAESDRKTISSDVTPAPPASK